MEKKKIFFVSDVHLGLYPVEKSIEREKLIVSWLDEIKDSVAELYLMGDIVRIIKLQEFLQLRK